MRLGAWALHKRLHLRSWCHQIQHRIWSSESTYLKFPTKSGPWKVRDTSARRNKLTDCEDRANRKHWKQGNLEMTWWFLGWSHPMSENEAGTWQRRPFAISPWKGSVFVGGWLPDHASTPCCMARSFTSIQMFHIHTPPAEAGPTLKRQKERNFLSHDEQKKKTARGGKKKRISRTNLHGVTDLPRTEHAQK